MASKYLLLLFVVLATVSSRSVKEDFTLNIVHVNDLHAHFDSFNKNGLTCSAGEEEAGECYGGLPRLMTKVKELMSRENTLFLNAGDFFQGTLYYSIFKGDVIAKMGNLMNMTAFALGNHEFDDGVVGVMNMTTQATFPILACNIDASLEPDFAKTIKGSIVVTIGGRKVGIVGYITQFTGTLSSPGEKLSFLDEITSIQKEVDLLKVEGVDIIIAVGHSGYAEDQAIATNVKGVDVVVGAHSHSFLWPDGVPLPAGDLAVGPYPTIVEQVEGSVTRQIPVVQAYAYGKYVGNIAVRFDESGEVVSFDGIPILVDQSILPDQEIVEALKPYYDVVQADYFHYVGKTNVFLNASGSMEETNMGNLITDAMVDWVSNKDAINVYADDYEWTKAAIAINNDGGIRASIDDTSRDGNITRGDIRSVIPFENELYIMELTGKVLKEALEHAVEKPSGAFLQVSGLQISIDSQLAAGKRVVEVHTRCQKCRVPSYEPLSDEKKYRVAAFSFVANGGDSFSMFKNKTVEKLDVKDFDVVESYIQKISPVNIGIEGRIRYVDTKSSAGNCIPSASLTLVFFISACLFFIE